MNQPVSENFEAVGFPKVYNVLAKHQLANQTEETQRKRLPIENMLTNVKPFCVTFMRPAHYSRTHDACTAVQALKPQALVKETSEATAIVILSGCGVKTWRDD